MVATPSPDSLRNLQSAIAAGHVVLIDEDARPLTLAESWTTSCWAHLRDVADGQVYVHPLRGSQELLRPNYQALFSANV